MTNRIISWFIKALFLLYHGSCAAQPDISYKTIDFAVEKIVSDLSLKFQNIQNNRVQQIIVLPIYNQKKEITDICKLLTNKIAHQLSIKLENNAIQFNVRSYFDFNDPALNKIVDSLSPILKSGDLQTEETFYRHLMKVKEIDYLIVGSYAVDFSGNNFIIENTKIIRNWKSEENTELVIKDVRDASVDLDRRYGWRAVGCSFVPSLQQYRCGRNTAGTLLLTCMIVPGLVSGVSYIEYNNYFNKAENTNNILERRDYLSVAKDWKIAGEIALASVGLVYFCNIIDGIANKKGRLKDKNSTSFNFSGTMDNKKFQFGLSMKF